MKRLGVFVVLYYVSFRHWRVFYSGGSLSKWALYQQCWRIYLWLHPGIYCFSRQDPMQRSVAVPWVRHLTARIPFLQSSKKCFHHLFLPDVNECTEVPGYCQNGICTNTIGSSRCRCRMGYRMNQSGDACIGKTTLTLSVTQGICIVGLLHSNWESKLAVTIFRRRWNVKAWMNLIFIICRARFEHLVFECKHSTSTSRNENRNNSCPNEWLQAFIAVTVLRFHVCPRLFRQM